ncbi:DUF6448 family protein [Arthrobacter sp. Ld5]|uniref:DUF6448 family protein n=1 Tax=Arthrobacter sp. Ld5 TaxID=649152 RepID=UPI003EBF41C1
MPPHCDSLDGPVVAAARRALDAADVGLVLPFVPSAAEAEVGAAFDAVLPVRGLSQEAREVADRLFFETVVRLHRTGEGAPYTGLKPAGLPVGPAIPLAERAIETGSADEVKEFLVAALSEQLDRRLALVGTLGAARGRSTGDARHYVEAMLGFEVYCNHVFRSLEAPVHGAHGEPGAGHDG